MLALCPEVLEYIIKTHSMSVENSMLMQIQSACKDYECSSDYGKQVAATQTLLGGSRTPGNQQSSRVQSNAHSHSSPPRPPQRANTSSHIDSDHSSALNGPATVATAIASSAPSGDPSTDAHTADREVTTAIALSVTPRFAPP